MGINAKTMIGIVVRTVDYKDNDRILTLFTQEAGRIDARAFGCRRQKSPLLPAAQPFVYGEFELFYKNGRYSVNQCDIRETFYPLREDALRFCAGSAMLALSQYAVQEHEPNPRLFFLLYYSLSYLTYSENDPADILICFLLRYLDAIGYRPAITSCAVCHRDLRAQTDLRFHVPDGGAVCAACRPGGNRVQRLSLEAMRRILALTDADILRVQLPQENRREIWRLLREYCLAVLEKEGRAAEILRQFEKMNFSDSTSEKQHI